MKNRGAGDSRNGRYISDRANVGRKVASARTGIFWGPPELPHDDACPTQAPEPKPVPHFGLSTLTFVPQPVMFPTFHHFYQCNACKGYGVGGVLYQIHPVFGVDYIARVDHVTEPSTQKKKRKTYLYSNFSLRVKLKQPLRFFFCFEKKFGFKTPKRHGTLVNASNIIKANYEWSVSVTVIIRADDAQDFGLFSLRLHVSLAGGWQLRQAAQQTY